MILILKAYQAAEAFLDMCFFRNFADDLGSLLGGMRLFKNQSDWKENPQTFDPRLWEDWILAVKKVLQKKEVEFEKLNVDQSFEVLKVFLDNYLNEIISVELQQLYSMINNINHDSVLWQDWLTCYQKAKQEKLSECSDTLLCQHKKFQDSLILDIIVKFLNYYSNVKEFKSFEKALISTKKNNNATNDFLNIKLVQLQKQYVHDNQITLLEEYQLFYKLPECYIHNLFSEELYDLYLKMKPYNTGQPEEYMVYYTWQKAAYCIMY